VHVDDFAGPDRRVELNLRQRPILGVPVVGRDESQPGREIDRRAARPDHAEIGDVDRSPVLFRPRRRVPVACQQAFANPGRAGVAPGVVIKVEAQARRGAGRHVAPRDQLVAFERPARRIQTGGDGVVGVARRPRRGGRPRCFGRGSRLVPCRRLCGDACPAGRHDDSERHDHQRSCWHAPILHQVRGGYNSRIGTHTFFS
jgi:hypothetical protein